MPDSRPRFVVPADCESAIGASIDGYTDLYFNVRSEHMLKFMWLFVECELADRKQQTADDDNWEWAG